MNAASQIESPVKGIQKWTTEAGIRSIRLHYSADPERDPDTPLGKAWIETMTKGLVGGVTNGIWRKEQEIDFSIREGLPIYKTFKEQRHVSALPLKPMKNVPILRGWDFGGTPACAITQRTFATPRWNIFPSLFVPNDQFSGIIRFGRTVIEYCNMVYPGYEFIDYADPAGDSRSQVDERTCFMILSSPADRKIEEGGGFGLNVQPGEVTWQGRFEAMETALSRQEDNGECFVQIDPRERFIIDAFNGGYRRRKIAGKDLYADDPEKNEYSHVMNALEYIASRIFTIKKKTAPKQPASDLATSYAV